MKLVRFGPSGQEKPGIWIDTPNGNEIVDVRAMAFDMVDYDAHFFTHWGLDRLRALLTESRLTTHPAEGLRLGCPVAPGGQVICVGKNYKYHVTEFGGEVPEAPLLFSKAPTTLCGAQDPLTLPQDEDHFVDGEVELGVILGNNIYGHATSDPIDAIAGYLVFNDITNRRAQRKDGQWFRGKSGAGYGPAGPFLVTPDEVPDPQNLRLWSSINGQSMQDGNTSDMMFSVRDILDYARQHIELQAGDLLATGTPDGIGSAQTPPVVLNSGDVLEAGIEGLGQQRIRVA